MTTTVTSTVFNVAILPPCGVCGQRASGFHYGANTCEACKGFFRRCIVRSTPHKCSHKDSTVKLPLAPGRRSACPGCRYKRCLSAGMSIEAIKTGRYTLEKRTQDTKEIKKLEVQNMITNDGGLVQTPAARMSELDRMIQRLTGIHHRSVNCTSEMLQTIVLREEEFLERRLWETEAFGSQKPLPRTEYNRIYDLTGIDIDGRKNIVAMVLPTLEKVTTDFTKFAQALPGFSQLPKRDQVILLKRSFWESWLFLFGSWCVNVENRLITYPYNTTVLFDDNNIQKFGSFDVNSLDDMWKLFSRYQQLELTEHEAVVTAALCIMNADATLSPVATPIVSGSVDYLLEILDYSIKRNHDTNSHTMCKLMTLISDMRSLRKYFDEFSHNFLSDGLDIGVPQIVKDLFMSRPKPS